MFKKISLLALLTLFLAAPVWSANLNVDVLEFETVDQEELYKNLIAVMRCPMCLNANLAGSDAAIAADLRAEIYDQVMAGQSDEEIMSFMTERYGEFINYKPPLNKSTFFLWFGPGLLLLAGFFIALRMMKSSQVNINDDSLSDEENTKLKKILSSHSDN